MTYAADSVDSWSENAADLRNHMGLRRSEMIRTAEMRYRMRYFFFSKSLSLS